MEVFVRPFPNVNGGKWQVSTNGGDAPLWAHSGKELFFVSASGDVMSTALETKPAFRVGETRKLFHVEQDIATPNWCCQWDISLDDQRFLMVGLAGAGSVADQRTVLVENWLEELREKTAKK